MKQAAPRKPAPKPIAARSGGRTDAAASSRRRFHADHVSGTFRTRLPSPIAHALGAAAAGWSLSRPESSRRDLDPPDRDPRGARHGARSRSAHRPPQPGNPQHRRRPDRRHRRGVAPLADRAPRRAHLARRVRRLVQPPALRRKLVRSGTANRRDALLAVLDTSTGIPGSTSLARSNGIGITRRSGARTSPRSCARWQFSCRSWQASGGIRRTR